MISFTFALCGFKRWQVGVSGWKTLCCHHMWLHIGPFYFAAAVEHDCNKHK